MNKEDDVFENQRCSFCNKPAVNYLFATFVCDSDICIDKARLERGGPGGHIKEKYGKKLEDK